MLAWVTASDDRYAGVGEGMLGQAMAMWGLHLLVGDVLDAEDTAWPTSTKTVLSRLAVTVG